VTSLLSRPSSGILSSIHKKLYRSYGPQGWWPGNGRFEIIVGAILTQNTAWSNVEKAIKNLKAEGLLSSPCRFHKADTRKIASLIRPAGYYNVKSKRLKNFTRFLITKYKGDLSRMAEVRTPRLRLELMAINGVGPETCDSILLYAFRRPVFVVDAYTRRIFSRHGLFGHDPDYGDIQELFMNNLPSDEKIFNEYHALLVRLAKDHCKTGPICAGCPLYGVKIVAKDLK
jgi:endonuclease III related protein